MSKYDFLNNLPVKKPIERQDSLTQTNSYIKNLTEITQNPKSIFASFGNTIHFTDGDRKLPAINRYHLVPFIKDHFVALNSHFDLSLDIDSLILGAYRNRKLGNFRYENEIQYVLDQCNNNLGDNMELPDCMTIFGPSGIGKTSSILQKLKQYEDVNLIREDNGSDCCQIMTKYVYVNCPDEGTIKDFFEVLLEQIAEKVGDPRIKNLYDENKDKGIPKLSDMLAKVCLTYGIGLLVLDEVQMLYSNDKKSTKEFRDFLTRFLNNLYASVIFIGTDEGKKLLENKVFLTRRLTSYREGYIKKFNYIPEELKPIGLDGKPKKTDWDIFLESLFKNCQITNVLTELTEDLKKTIFDLSKGFPYAVKQLFQGVQRTLIKQTIHDPKHKEIITSSLLREVAQNDFRELNLIYTGIEKGDISMIRQFNDAGVEIRDINSIKRDRQVDMSEIYKEFRQRISEIVYIRGYDKVLSPNEISTIINQWQISFTNPVYLEIYIEETVEAIGKKYIRKLKEQEKRKKQNQSF